IEGLQSEDARVHRASAAILAQIDPLPPSAAAGLEKVLKDKDTTVAAYAALALSGIPGHVKPALPVFVQALQKRQLRPQILEAMGKAGPEAKDALPILLRSLQDETTDFMVAGRIGAAIE